MHKCKLCITVLGVSMMCHSGTTHGDVLNTASQAIPYFGSPLVACAYGMQHNEADSMSPQGPAGPAGPGDQVHL
jgi:hypothetical protein